MDANDLRSLALSSKQYFGKIAGNLDKLKRHLSHEFILNFPTYFVGPFPEKTCLALEYFKMYCRFFGTEIDVIDSKFNQYSDYNRIEDSSYLVQTESQFNNYIIKLVDGQIIISLEKKGDYKYNGHSPLVWEHDEHLYTICTQTIDNNIGSNEIDRKNKTFTPAHFESNEYRVCAYKTPGNFKMFVRKFPIKHQ